VNVTQQEMIIENCLCEGYIIKDDDGELFM